MVLTIIDNGPTVLKSSRSPDEVRLRGRGVEATSALLVLSDEGGIDAILKRGMHLVDEIEGTHVLLEYLSTSWKG